MQLQEINLAFPTPEIEAEDPGLNEHFSQLVNDQLEAAGYPRDLKLDNVIIEPESGYGPDWGRLSISIGKDGKMARYVYEGEVLAEADASEAYFSVDLATGEMSEPQVKARSQRGNAVLRTVNPYELAKGLTGSFPNTPDKKYKIKASFEI